MVIEKVLILKMAMISVLNLSNLGPLTLLTTTNSPSRYNPTFCFSSSTDNLCRKFKPTMHICAL